MNPVPSPILRRMSVLSKALLVLLLVVLYQRLIWLENLHHPLWQAVMLAAVGVLVGVFLTRRWLAGAAVGMVMYLALRWLSKTKVDLLQEPLVFADIRHMSMMELWELAHSYPVHIALGCGLLVLFIVWLVWLQFRSVQHPWRASTRVRWMAGVGAVLGSGIILHGTKNFELGMYPPSTSLLTFISTASDETPMLYSALPPRPHAPQVQCPSSKMNVLSVLQESTFKPADADLTPITKSFFNGNLYAGPLTTHVVGGGTHVTEFAFLIGFPHLALQGENTFPQGPLTGRIQRSLPQWFKACGYETTVVYPTRRHFRNSAHWYSSLGFDHVISAEDAGISNWHVPDAEVLSRALAQLPPPSPTAKPQFVYVLTIAQHGPHDKHDPRADYLKRLQSSAQGWILLRQLLLKRSQQDGPWLVNWFGDHRPNRVGADGPEKWTTWGVMETIPGDSNDSTHQPKALDIAFWGGEVMRQAGLDVQPLMKLQDQLRQECPEQFMKCSVASQDQLKREFLDIGGILPPQP